MITGSVGRALATLSFDDDFKKVSVSACPLY